MNLQVLPGESNEEEVFHRAEAIHKPYFFPYDVPRRTGFGWMYHPKEGDIVIGIVVNRGPEEFRLDIRAGLDGHLPTTAFTNATKHHHPNLTVGSIVLCGVNMVRRNPPFVGLTCLSPDDPKSWSSKEYYLGELSQPHSMIMDFPLAYTEALLGDFCATLVVAGQLAPCETAVGLNGRVYVAAGSSKDVFAVANAIKKCQHLRNIEDIHRIAAEEIPSD